MSKRSKYDGKPSRRLWLRILLILVALICVLAAGLRLRYGGGENFPDRSTAARLPASALQLVASLDQPPGNIAVSRSGRIFITFHPEAKPQGMHVAEIVDGKPQAFPDQAAQQELYRFPQGIRVDSKNRLWTIDHGDNGIHGARLAAVDIDSRKVVYRYDFPSNVAGLLSYLQDLAIDPSGRYVYIADVNFFGKSPALIVVDTVANESRRLLENDVSVQPQNYLIRAYNGPMVRLGGLIALRAGVDSIAIHPAGDWLYYGPMNHEDLFRIRTADLNNPALSADQLAARVEKAGPKVQSDGITIDNAGNVYLTDMEHRGIAVLGADGKLFTLVTSDAMRWPDGFSFGPDGWLYIADSDIPDIALQSQEHIRAHAPYHLFRIRPGHDGVAGQ
ncbi:MAG: hypothetical protein K1X75_07385 [Leptospirales bacterium]|nr:hypothetical protein [Leptospirales bacterium]